MSDAKDTLFRMLGLTREQELDCDAFCDHLAAYVDGAITDDALKALMAHHEEICPECEEQRVILARAIGGER